jgi:hypothetical protein
MRLRFRRWGTCFCFSLLTSFPSVHQSGTYEDYFPYLENIVKKLRAWAGPAGNADSVKLLFALTSPMLNDVAIDDVVVAHNALAEALMANYSIPTLDLHQPIIDKCGPVPQASCFGESGCWSPHCPPGYEWLANSTIVPAVQKFIS